jgi:hypothetical protein
MISVYFCLLHFSLFSLVFFSLACFFVSYAYAYVSRALGSTQNNQKQCRVGMEGLALRYDI